MHGSEIPRFGFHFERGEFLHEQLPDLPNILLQVLLGEANFAEFEVP